MKKLAIALILALVMVLSLSVPALAWDVEDPSVADNDSFNKAQGRIKVDEGYKTVEEHWGGNSTLQPDGSRGPDGYNVYQDDGSGQGWLDKVKVREWPGDWDTVYNGIDLYYFAQEPGGYNYPEPEPLPEPAPKVFVYPYHDCHLNVVLPNAHRVFEYHGRAIEVDFSDGVWRIQIPHGTWVIGDSGGQPIRLTVDNEGQILNGITFKYHGDNGVVSVTRVD